MDAQAIVGSRVVEKRSELATSTKPPTLGETPKEVPTAQVVVLTCQSMQENSGTILHQTQKNNKKLVLNFHPFILHCGLLSGIVSPFSVQLGNSLLSLCGHQNISHQHRNGHRTYPTRNWGVGFSLLVYFWVNVTAPV
jgi:hypothetical protein